MIFHMGYKSRAYTRQKHGLSEGSDMGVGNRRTNHPPLLDTPSTVAVAINIIAEHVVFIRQVLTSARLAEVFII